MNSMSLEGIWAGFLPEIQLRPLQRIEIGANQVMIKEDGLPLM
jgi:hypothetical protein